MTPRRFLRCLVEGIRRFRHPIRPNGLYFTRYDCGMVDTLTCDRAASTVRDDNRTKYGIFT